jgi:hypothetical protein
LQKFDPKEELNNPGFTNRKAYSEEEMQEFKKLMQKYVGNVFIR